MPVLFVHMIQKQMRVNVHARMDTQTLVQHRMLFVQVYVEVNEE